MALDDDAADALEEAADMVEFGGDGGGERDERGVVDREQEREGGQRVLGDEEKEAERGGGDESNERGGEGDGALRDPRIRLHTHTLGHGNNAETVQRVSKVCTNIAQSARSKWGDDASKGSMHDAKQDLVGSDAASPHNGTRAERGR